MYEFVNFCVRILKKIVPESVVRPLRPAYHLGLAFFMALSYGFPARRLVVIGVTGTKGKSSVAEMLFAILRAAGYKTALLSTIRFAIEDVSEPNLYKMTLHGRGFAQSFMRRALRAECTHVVVEITSESVRNYRHLFLDLDELIFTNLQKEHIESHGSFENYFKAKLEIGRALVRSPKRPRTIVANAGDARGAAFLALPVENKIPFSRADAARAEVGELGVAFDYGGMHFSIPQPGEFSVMNALAAIKATETLGVPLETAASALHQLARIPGRAERIECGQNFLVIVDYAHTPDSLTALYEAFPNRRKIGVLGNTGGGRDTWKRPLMGSIAERYCDEIILTNEDPYDESPEKIVQEMAAGMKNKKTQIIMDRRSAIRAALCAARPGDAVLISGKGTDPFIMEAAGKKTPWSDAVVVREELEQLLLS